MQVVGLLNEKGGVGKTTSAVTLASALAIEGARVLLIDSDPQGHATKSLQAKKRDGLIRLLAQEGEWHEVTVGIDKGIWAGNFYDAAEGRLTLVPSHLNNRALPVMLDGNFMALRERLEEIRDQVDVVVFDTAPGPTVVHGMIYLASDYILFPTECEYLSLDGLSSSTSNMMRGGGARERVGLPPVQLMGIQPIKYQIQTTNHQENLARMREHFGGAMVWEPIARRTIWAQAVQAGLSIFAFAAGHDAELQAWGMADRVLEVIHA